MRNKANEPAHATCTLGSVILEGREVRVAPETVGVLHILEEVRSERIRLIILKTHEETNRLTGLQRELVALRECTNCHTVYVETRDEDGVQFLNEHRRGGTLLADAPPSDEDRSS
jgi:hypothetical protein